MRGIKLKMNITDLGIHQGHRYCVRVGDGSRSEIYTLADPTDRYAGPQWSSLIGSANRAASWSTDSGWMYVDVWRQYPNPAFDFSIESYQRHDWLLADVDVTTFRLYNPLFARACLDWPHGNKWDGGSIPFSEGDSHDFKYDVDIYQFKYNEKGVRWSVKRHDDSDNFKEFELTLTV